MNHLDARGLSCPEPVIMISKAMKSGNSQYEIIVDNHAAKENVTRYAEHQGYSVSVNEMNGEYTLHIQK
ncbi:MAG: sulfurtransferase TusA family protein [Lachnospiraceae bacterium]|nr:sulfurtransferase TusA family protein [Lachnospiraceae bacterium]